MNENAIRGKVNEYLDKIDFSKARKVAPKEERKWGTYITQNGIITEYTELNGDMIHLISCRKYKETHRKRNSSVIPDLSELERISREIREIREEAKKAIEEINIK